MSAVEHDYPQLGTYMLGALEMNEAVEFETHLLSCAECRAEVAELSLLLDQLDEMLLEAATDPCTGVRMAAAVTPAAGWVRVHIAVQGAENGEK
jgi:anti-sigma factor RsiW